MRGAAWAWWRRFAIMWSVVGVWQACACAIERRRASPREIAPPIEGEELLSLYVTLAAQRTSRPAGTQILGVKKVGDVGLAG